MRLVGGRRVELDAAGVLLRSPMMLLIVDMGEGTKAGWADACMGGSMRVMIACGLSERLSIW